MVTEFGMTMGQGPHHSTPLALPIGDYSLSDSTRRDVDSSARERETLTREDLDEIFDAHDLRRTLIPEHHDAPDPNRRFSPGALLPTRSTDEPQDDSS
ncbi:hypothetical protein BH20ACT15_BH20ACT15_14240 [soil metagenome]